MRMQLSTTIVVLSLGLATTTFGQTAPNGGTNTPTGQSSGSVMTQNPESHWIASGFAGSNFGMNADPGSGTFGGSVGYLWKSKVGAEIETGFIPNFQHQSSFFGLGLTPDVNDYMGNIIGAIPLGADGA